MSPNVRAVGRAGSDSCHDDGLHHAAEAGGLRLLPAALAEKQELDGEWEDESVPCSSGPALELGGAFGSGWIKEEILPWVFADVLRVLRW